MLSLATRAAAADPAPDLTHYVHLETPSSVATDGGSTIRLPPGYFFDEPTYGAVDTEYKRLQTAETRLTAENSSMRATLAGWQPGFWTLATVLAGGIVLGYEIEKHL